MTNMYQQMSLQLSATIRISGVSTAEAAAITSQNVTSGIGIEEYDRSRNILVLGYWWW